MTESEVWEWYVTINNKHVYAVTARDAGMASSLAGDIWRHDPNIRPEQRAQGLYALDTKRGGRPSAEPH